MNVPDCPFTYWFQDMSIMNKADPNISMQALCGHSFQLYQFIFYSFEHAVF